MIRDERQQLRATTREKNREVQRARIEQFSAIIGVVVVLSLTNLGTQKAYVANHVSSESILGRVLVHLTFWIILTTVLVVLNLLILSGQYMRRGYRAEGLSNFYRDNICHTYYFSTAFNLVILLIC